MNRPADAIGFPDLLDLAERAGFTVADVRLVYESGYSAELLLEGMRVHAAARTMHLVGDCDGLKLVAAVDPPGSIVGVWDAAPFEEIAAFEAGMKL